MRTSIGTLASTKAHPRHAVEKRTARPVTIDNISFLAVLTLSERLIVRVNFRVSIDYYFDEEFFLDEINQ